MSSDSDLIVEYLASTRIGEKGQLTVPKQYRDAMGLKTGTHIAVLRVGDGLILVPEQSQFNQLCESINASLEEGGLSEADLQATLPEARRRVFERRYPRLARKQRVERKAKES